MTQVSARAKKLETINKEILTFLATEVHADEQDIKEYLAQAILQIIKATGIIVSNDKEASEATNP